MSSGYVPTMEGHPSTRQGLTHLSILVFWMASALTTFLLLPPIVHRLFMIATSLVLMIWPLYLAYATYKNGSLHRKSITWQLTLITYIMINMPMVFFGLVPVFSAWKTFAFRASTIVPRSCSLAVFSFTTVALFQNITRFPLDTSTVRIWIWKFALSVIGMMFLSMLGTVLSPRSDLAFAQFVLNVVTSILQIFGTLGFVSLAFTLRRRISTQKPERNLVNSLSIIICLALYESLCHYVIPTFLLSIKKVMDPMAVLILLAIVGLTRLIATFIVIAFIHKLDVAEQQMADPLPRWADPTELRYEDEDFDD